MNIIEANCNNCCKRERFEYLENNNYKCMSCNTILHKCKSKECNNMINKGVVCSKCIGKGLKNGGSLVCAAVVGVIGFGIKSALGIKGSNKI